MVDLERASLFPIVPLSQASDAAIVKPSIIVVGENEYLIVSWTGASTIGLFLTSDGDPVRGTLEWPRHPEAICMCLSLQSCTASPIWIPFPQVLIIRTLQPSFRTILSRFIILKPKRSCRSSVPSQLRLLHHQASILVNG